MNLTVNHLPKKWAYGNSKSFANWFKNHIKSPFKIQEDYQLLNK